MNSRLFTLYRLSSRLFYCFFKMVLIVLSFSLLACGGGGGGGDSEPAFTISGTVSGQSILDNPDKPVQVAVVIDDGSGRIALDSLDNVVRLVSVNKSTLSFNIDLADSGLKPGDRVNIAAFVDMNASSDRFPALDGGDYVGFYLDRSTYATAYTLQSGVNSGVHLEINRLMREHTAQINGRVKTDIAGDLVIVAYAGEMDSLDFSGLNPDEIIGYARMAKGAAEVDYRMQILPFPDDVTTDYIYVAAFLDDSGSGVPAPGNLIGFHADAGVTAPALVDIDPTRDLTVSGVDIDWRFTDASGQQTVTMRIPEPSDDNIVLNGRFNLPGDYDVGQGAVFLLVARADELSDLTTAPLSAIAFFRKMEPGVSNFSLDLSDTGLALTDEVMVLALWDRDYEAGFPSLSAGDRVGLLQNTADFAYTIQLSGNLDYTGLSGGWSFNMNRVMPDYQAQISGRVRTDAAGDLVVVAYAGEMNSLDFGNLDPDAVIGFVRLAKEAAEVDYTIESLPYPANLNTDNVYVAAFIDETGAGIPAPGNRIGFHVDATGAAPALIALDFTRDETLTGVDIDFLFADASGQPTVEMRIPEPSGDIIVLDGRFNLPGDYNADQGAVYVLVARGDDLSDISASPLSTIVYFRKMTAGETLFSLDLSDTGLALTDEVTVLALWDRDYEAGFPSLSAGDRIGLLQNTAEFAYTIQLSGNLDYTGLSGGWSFNMNRLIPDYQAQISGRVRTDAAGDLVVVAYAGEMTSLDFGDLDPDRIIGFVRMDKGAADVDYTIQALPYPADLSTDNIYLAAFIDETGAGIPAPGNRIGFHVDATGAAPALIDLDFTRDVTLTGVDIDFLFADASGQPTVEMRIPEPSGDIIVLDGRFNLPGDYDTDQGAVYVLVARGDDLSDISASPLSTIVYFRKMAAGETLFSLDLSDTGLSLTDEVTVLALWDRDYAAGFPGLSAGDRVGLLQNNAEFSYTVPLSGNLDFSDLSGGWSFNLNRVMTDNEVQISGRVRTDISGDLVVVAYAGEMTSLDFGDLDPDGIIGFVRLDKGAAEVDYTIQALPYPADLSTDNVYLAAFIDETGAGIPGPGNRIGFHADATGAAPALIALDFTRDEMLTGVDIDFLFADASGQPTVEMRIPEPSGDFIVLDGRFNLPGDYDTDQGAVYVLVARGDDLSDISASPLSTIVYFRKMAAGETLFSLDLSDTGLALTDEVTVLAMWDRDYAAGFPSLSVGDSIGLLQNKAEFSYTVPLSGNLDFTDLSGDWSFDVNKIMYDHQARIQFNVSSVEDDTVAVVPQAGDRILVYAVAEQGVDLTADPYIDMDYVVGTGSITVGTDGPPYTFDILPAIHSNITVTETPFTIEGIYLYGVLDDNGNGLPDDDEHAGYSGFLVVIAYPPVSYDLEDGINVLDYPLVFPVIIP